MLSRIHRLGLEIAGKETETEPRLCAYGALETHHSIRLLNIIPIKVDTAEEPRWRYKLITTNTQDAPAYETLSYVWGTSSRNESLELSNGTLLRTTKTLEQALPNIANQCSTGYLWIDQICINQDDLSERAQQVSIMRDIYSKCQRVLVWLGPMASLEVGIAAQLLSLDQLVSPSESSDCKESVIPACGGYYPSCQQCQNRIIDKMICCKPRQKTLVGLCHEIIENSWFSRAWVFQEVVLPRKSAFILQCTKSSSRPDITVALPTLYALCKVAWRCWNPAVVRFSLQKREGLSTTSRYGVLKEMYDRWTERHAPSGMDPMPLYQVLSTLSAGARTSTAHDQLYAFFGLNQNDRIRLKPSYQAPLQHALIVTAGSIIKGTKSLDIFETLPRKTTSKATRSWVPDFTSPRLVIPFLSSSAATWSSNKCPEIHPWSGRSDGYTLWTHGKIVAVVDLCIDHQVATSVDTDCAYAPLLVRIIQAWSNSRHYDYCVPLPIINSILSALTAEGHCEPSTYDAEDAARFGSRVRNQYRQFQSPGRMNTEATRIHYRDATGRHLAEYVNTVMNGRQLWITQGGRLATGSRLQKGDEICILHGCSHPVALRRVPKKDAYTVVSTCYLEDWMDPWGRGKVDWKDDEAHEFALI